MAGLSHKALFNVLRNCQTIFQTGYTIIAYSHQKPMKVLIASLPCQHSIVSAFFVLAFLIGVGWYLTLVLVIIYLIGNDTKHLSCAYLPSVSFLKCVSSLLDLVC